MTKLCRTMYALLGYSLLTIGCLLMHMFYVHLHHIVCAENTVTVEASQYHNILCMSLFAPFVVLYGKALQPWSESKKTRIIHLKNTGYPNVAMSPFCTNVACVHQCTPSPFALVVLFSLNEPEAIKY